MASGGLLRGRSEVIRARTRATCDDKLKLAQRTVLRLRFEFVGRFPLPEGQTAFHLLDKRTALRGKD